MDLQQRTQEAADALAAGRAGWLVLLEQEYGHTVHGPFDSPDHAWDWALDSAEDYLSEFRASVVPLRGPEEEWTR